MGYFKQPVRRGVAGLAKRELLDPARDLPAGAWTRCGRERPRATDRFLRFVIEHPDGRRVGLFRSSDLLEEDDDFPIEARRGLGGVYDWFNVELPVPRGIPQHAVCWFRADAHDALDRVRTLIELFRVGGYVVWQQATRRPGRVVYRDAQQIAAVPDRDQRVTMGTW